MKRLLNLFLTIVLIVSGIPMTASANGTESNLNTGDTQIEGQNDFGNLLADDIQAEYEKEQNQGGYSILDITIEGNMAVVEYSAVEEALLVVGIYEEGWNANIMTNSGKAVVSPDATEATVTIEGDMPEYFTVSGYLVDTEDYSPLCDSCENPMYTYEMQKLLNSTVNDYEPERVLNLDDDETTNFAVYSEWTCLIKEEEGVNQLTFEEESNTYIFENADERIMNLNEYDVFSYIYDSGNVLIARVISIEIVGTTVFIQGEEAQIQEVFAYVKIEENTDINEVEFDSSTLGEGIIYNGRIEEAPSTYGLHSGSGIASQDSLNKGMSFDLHIEKDKAILAGVLGIDISLDFEYYSTISYTYVSLVTDVHECVDISVSGTANFMDNRLGTWKFPLAMGSVTVVCEPKFQIRFDTEMDFSGNFIFTKGFTYDSREGFREILSLPRLTSALTVEGELFIGLDLCPGVEVLGSALVDVEAQLPVGIAIKAELSGTTSEINIENQPERHTCKRCLDIEIDVVAGLDVSMEFLNSMTIEENLISYSSHLCDMYYSGDHNEVGMGTCPYKEYLVIIEVLDKASNKAFSASINRDGEYIGRTNALGVFEVYMENGVYLISASPCDEVYGETTEKKICITEPSCFMIKLKGGAEEEKIPGNLGLDAEQWENLVCMEPGGQCGNEVNWVVDSTTGTLIIYGKGRMWDYSDSEELPWAGENLHFEQWGWGLERYVRYHYIRNVVVDEGVTYIGDYAFNNLTDLNSVQLPSSIRSFGEYIFGSTEIPYLKIPKGVTSIPTNMFYNAEITTLELPDSVIRIEESAFCYASIEELILPDSMVTIGEKAFFLSNITNIKFPEKLREIGDYAFMQGSPANIELPENLQIIGEGAFYCSGLESVKLPENLQIIGDRAFSECRLESIKLPDNVEIIGNEVFEGCASLENVELSENLRIIGDEAFNECNNLTSIELPDTLEKVSLPESITSVYITDAAMWCNLEGLYDIEYSRSLYLNGELVTDFVVPDGIEVLKGSFSGLNKLKSITIPSSVREITSSFYGCDNLEAVYISDMKQWMETSFSCITAENNYNTPLMNGANLYLNNELVTELVTAEYEGADFIRSGVFEGCTSLRKLEICEYFNISESVFKNCVNLETVVFHDGVFIGYDAFEGCSNLKEIIFYGNSPGFGYLADENGPFLFYSPFNGVNATLYYPADDETWEGFPFEGLGGNLTIVPYTLDENGEIVPVETSIITVQESEQEVVALKEETLSVEMPTSYAMHWGGENAEGIYQTATFGGLVPGEDYIVLALKDIDASELLASENLIFIEQKTADKNGFVFVEYEQLEELEYSSYIACGKSNKNLNNATITFARMQSSEESQMVDITVEYDGEILELGTDYTLMGKITFTEEGNYTCLVKGIGEYTGLVECAYKVGAVGIPGDVNGDKTVDTSDAQAIFNHFMGISVLEDSVLSLADVNGDNSIDTSDAQMVFNMFMGII